MRHLVKNGRRIKGFVWEDKNNKWWFAFGRPSAPSYMAFGCKDLEDGKERITNPM